MQNKEKVIEIKGLTKKYKAFEAVKGIDFFVEKGEIFGILGPNGAGKTTTLEIIEGLKKQTSGSVMVLGLDNTTSGKEIKKRIGVQLQSSEYLNNLTLSELLVLFASLQDKAKSLVKELSGGQKQRFTIASALVHKPEILFMDEPTTGLDPQARREMWNLVKELNAQGITVVLTTHYMEEAEYLCNRVAIMDSGKILKLDSPQALIQSLSKLYKLSFFADKPISDDFFYEFGNPKTFNENPKVIVELEDISLLPKIIEKLTSRGINYKFLNLKTATLEDFYLHLTGHEYEQA
jgi:ABC-2 type transport system ATP-binding protein